jgi:aminoglycoside phosphotransferase
VKVALDPDPAVPQRDLMLDPCRMAVRLGHLLAVEIDSCRQVRVKYRVGARVRTVHRIQAGSSSFHVAASSFPSLERSERAYADALERAVECGPVPPVLLDRQLRAVFWTFPNDRKIKGLPALAGPADSLAELHPAWCRSEVASYAPEKAATVRCLDDEGRTVGYAKAYAGEEGARARHVHEALTSELGAEDPQLTLPRALGYSTPHRTLLVEKVEGAPLHAVSNAGLGYRRLGQALARLHSLAAPDSVRFRRADPDRLNAAAGLIASVRKDVATSARELASELGSRLDGEAEALCLHGDVNFRNALLDNGRVALIDLDQVATGPAAAELGSVLASLRYAGVVGLLPASRVPKLCSSLISGYAEVRPAPADEALRVHTAAALLGERALRVVTRVREEGLRRLPQLLGAAREVLA